MTTASLTFAEALGRPRTVRISKSKLASARREAKAAAGDLVTSLRALSRREQVSVAEALIGAFMQQVDSLTKATRKAFDPSQPRAPAGTPEGGQWTASGVAGAAARGTGRLALAGSKIILRAAQNALSTITLVPSTKRTVGAALKDWWSRVTSSDSTTHIVAVQEAAARVLFTIMLGAAAVALAHAFIGSAAGAVGAAVGSALRVLLGR